MNPILRTADREARIEQWMCDERARVEAAFGPGSWERVVYFIESVPWQSDGQAALAAAANHLMHSGGLMTADQAARDVAGRRTVASLTRFEHVTLMSEHLGLRFEETVKYIDQLEDGAAPLAEETALYRHSDSRGRVLYIGIATDPATRSEQHRARSNWWRFVESTHLEWFTSRQAAQDAERAAIRAEMPIFNKTHNKANRDAAVAYLFDAISGATA